MVTHYVAQFQGKKRASFNEGRGNFFSPLRDNLKGFKYVSNDMCLRISLSKRYYIALLRRSSQHIFLVWRKGYHLSSFKKKCIIQIYTTVRAFFQEHTKVLALSGISCQLKEVPMIYFFFALLSFYSGWQVHLRASCHIWPLTYWNHWKGRPSFFSSCSKQIRPSAI